MPLKLTILTFSKILMDYCGVGSVKDVAKATGENLEEEQCRYVVQGTLKGLAYMHNMGILHLDIKAANSKHAS